MGSVALARLSIEQTREYSIGYAFALGVAALIVMVQFVGNPVFCIFILFLIGFLSDRIVYDCTLIDDDVDASGEGLVDAGRLFVRKKAQERLHASSNESSEREGSAIDSGEDETEPKRRPRKTHQPGRTVMYLAIGALPLFGLGQFFIGGNEKLWAASQTFLGLYLFSALSLLVTTSFLGLRRYLRQRNADMPRNVSVAWLAGGVGLIAVVLLLSFLAPLPGKALASLEAPKWLSSPDMSASSAGWGDEAAEESNENSAQTREDQNPGDKQTQGTKDGRTNEAEPVQNDPNARTENDSSASTPKQDSSGGKSGSPNGDQPSETSEGDGQQQGQSESSSQNESSQRQSSDTRQQQQDMESGRSGNESSNRPIASSRIQAAILRRRNKATRDRSNNHETHRMASNRSRLTPIRIRNRAAKGTGKTAPTNRNKTVKIRDRLPRIPMNSASPTAKNQKVDRSRQRSHRKIRPPVPPA